MREKYTLLWDLTVQEKVRLSSVIAGKEEYEVTRGEIIFEGEELSEFAPEERAHKGIFLSFQYPVEIPGVTVTNFMRTVINANRKAKGLERYAGQ